MIRMTKAKTRVEIAPWSAHDWAVTLWTIAAVAAVLGVVFVVQAGALAQGWSGALFAVAGVCAVGGVIISATRS